MSEQSDQFTLNAEAKVFDPEHRRKLFFNISQYDKKVEEGLHQFSDLELAKQRAANLKWKSIENLEKHLTEFEINFSRRGGKVIWAQDAAEAIVEITEILKRAN